MARSVEEWVATHDDQAVPDRVKLRIWRDQGGVCGLTGIKIQPTDKKHLHHRLALALGGQHRESNLAWVLASANAEEAKREVAIKAANDARAKKHLGIRTAPTKPIVSAPFAKSSKAAARAERGHKASLPPRIWPGFVSAGEQDR